MSEENRFHKCLAHQIFNCPCGRTPENHIPTDSFAESLCLDLYHIESQITDVTLVCP